MKKLMVIIVMMILSLSIHSQSGNSCYIVLGNYTGNENLHPTILFDTVCNLVNRFDEFMEKRSSTRWSNTFKIVTNLPYPAKAYKDDAGNFDAVYSKAVEDIKEISPHYIGVIKELHSSFIKFRIVMNLPNSGSLQGLDDGLKEALRQEIETAMNISYAYFRTSHMAEIAGYSVLMKFIDDLENGSLNYFEMMDFIDMPFNSSDNVRRTNSSFTQLENGKNFGGIIIGANGNQDIGNSLEYVDEYGVTYGYIISSKNDLIVPGRINEIGSAFAALSADVKIWFHFDFILDDPALRGGDSGNRNSGEKNIKIKFDSKITESKSDQILEGNYNKKDKKADCSFPNEDFGQNCIIPHGQDIFGTTPGGSFLTGVFAGSFGSLFDNFYFLYSSAQGVDLKLLTKIGAEFFSFAVLGVGPYVGLKISSAVIFAIRDFETFRKKIGETKAQAEETIDKILDVGKIIFEGVSKLNKQSLINIGNGVIDAVKIWLADFLNDVDYSVIGLIVGTVVGAVIYEVFESAILGGFKGVKITKELSNLFKILDKRDEIKNYCFNKLNKFNGKKAKCGIKIKGGCFVKDTPVLMAHNPFINKIAGMALATMPMVAPIQNILPDDMVKAYHHEDLYLTASNVSNDIYVPGWQSYDYLNITPETWQIGTFEIIEASGDKVEVEANRPKTWYQENNVNTIGDKAHFYMPEIGINGEATLLSIRPTVINTTIFALNKNGIVDRPVITTFKRNAPVVFDYHFSDGSVVGATSEHPFFSVDRNAYIAVGELQLGEQVMTAGQKVVKFLAGKQRDKGEPVYNFEVWREHNYYVGSEVSGEFMLVHNNYGELLNDFISGIFNATKAYHGNYKCEGLSKALRKYYKSKGHNVVTKRVETRDINGRLLGSMGYIDKDGKAFNISTNGVHEFTRINDKIFDNNNPYGVPSDEYFNKFAVLGEGLTTRVIDITD